MKKKVLSIALAFSLTFSPLPSKADMFGGDVAVLVQILAQAVQQLAQLKALLENGQDTLGLLQDINRGINDALSLYKTAFPNADPGVYANWVKLQDGLNQVGLIYGTVIPATTETIVQRDTDQGVAEAITLNNSIYQYTKEIDDIGEQVKSYSHSVSPGGAQKLTAQTLGVMLHVMNQGLRAQATSLKIQAQALAVQNRKEKLMTEKVIASASTLQAALKKNDVSFQLPRF